MLVATCQQCGETFSPSSEDHLKHYYKENNRYCGGEGEITEMLVSVEDVRRTTETIWPAVDYELVQSKRDTPFLLWLIVVLIVTDMLLATAIIWGALWVGSRLT